MAISYNGYRRQQIVYGVTLLFAVVGCVSSGMLNRFNDIDFDAPRLEQVRSITRGLPPLLYTNVALAVFSFALLVTDLFRSKAVPVWFELVWTFLFGTLELVNTVMAGMQYPTHHCSSSPLADTKLRKRDDIEGSVEGSYLNYQTSENKAKIVEAASSELCANWSVMFVVFAMIVMLLFIQLGWLTLLGLRHRFSHPSFWTYATPAPYTWHLEHNTQSRPSDVESITSTTSTAASFKKSEKTLQLPISVFSQGQR